MIKECIQKILTGEHLSTEEAAAAMGTIMRGEATPAQIAGLLIALKQKGETVQEVAGFVTTMREHSLKIHLGDLDAVDLVGTGGDGAHTFNISTAAALAAASTGLPVAKHGNRSVSSKCGSADLLEAVGGNIDPGPDIVRSNIIDFGFGFMFAPRYHPAMRYAAAPRRELGIRTVFNILGPMTNPCSVRCQVTGVYDPSLIPLMAEVLQTTGSRRVVVAHSRDGLDEFSISAPTDYVEINNGAVTQCSLTPENAGIRNYPTGVLQGGEPAQNVLILQQIAEGETSPFRDAVALNAGVLVYVAGRADSITDGVRLVDDAIDRGRMLELINRWRLESQV